MSWELLLSQIPEHGPAAQPWDPHPWAPALGVSHMGIISHQSILPILCDHLKSRLFSLHSRDRTDWFIPLQR